MKKRSVRKGSVRILSFNCKKLVCVLLAVITVLAMTSVFAFAENEAVTEPTQEDSAADTSVSVENGETIFEVINRGEGTLTERVIHGLKVTLVGMITVFAVLIVLMVILYLFQLVFSRSSKKTEDKPAVNATSAPATASAPVAAAVQTGTKEDEIVAVATAAIAAARGESDCAFNVISITQIN